MNWQDIAVHDDKSIRGFFGPYRWMSNFHLSPVEYEGMVFPSAENAYMAAKTVVMPQRTPFITIAPSMAKKLGRTIVLREDWEQVKFDIMYQLNLQKYSNHPELRAALLATGDKYLEETNWWGDVIWGVCKNIGENNLGKILMRIRTELRG